MEMGQGPCLSCGSQAQIVCGLYVCAFWWVCRFGTSISLMAESDTDMFRAKKTHPTTRVGPLSVIRYRYRYINHIQMDHDCITKVEQDVEG